MKNNKKIIILSIIVGLLILLLIILSIIKSNTKNTINIGKINDNETFFKINHLINEHEKTDKYLLQTFYTKKIYYIEHDIINIYFINGFTINYNKDSEYIDNVNYLLKTKGANYELTKLDQITNIEEYANNYNDRNTTIDSNHIIPTYTYKEESKLVYYISIFTAELNNNPNNAYNMLTDRQKQQYAGVDNFIKNKKLIKKDLSTFITNYKTNTNHNETIYNINTKNNKSITIYEKGLMDFTIEY